MCFLLVICEQGWGFMNVPTVIQILLPTTSEANIISSGLEPELSHSPDYIEFVSDFQDFMSSSPEPQLDSGDTTPQTNSSAKISSPKQNELEIKPNLTNNSPTLEEKFRSVANLTKKLPNTTESKSYSTQYLARTALSILPHLSPISKRDKYYNAFRHFITKKSYYNFLPKFKSSLLRFQETKDLDASFDGFLKFHDYAFLNCKPNKDVHRNKYFSTDSASPSSSKNLILADDSCISPLTTVGRIIIVPVQTPPSKIQAVMQLLKDP